MHACDNCGRHTAHDDDCVCDDCRKPKLRPYPHPQLRILEAAEERAWRAMMYGSEEDARSVRGEEGKNYLAWCAAADACYAYREEHGLVGQEVSS